MYGSAVLAEVFLIAVRGGTLVYERRVEPVTGPALEQVWSLADHDGSDPTVCVHSTSWRQTADGVLLTWVVAPGPVGDDAVTFNRRPATETTDRLDVPVAELPSVDAVLSHALGHLRFLAERDQQLFLPAWNAHTDLWATIWGFDATIAGRLAEI